MPSGVRMRTEVFLPKQRVPEPDSLSCFSTLPSSNDIGDGSVSHAAQSYRYKSTSTDFGSAYFQAISHESLSLRCDRTAPLPRSRTWCYSHRDYVKGKLLGQGTYGSVYKATATRAGIPPVIALKISRMDGNCDEPLPETCLREAVLLQELNGHDNVVKLYGLSCPSADTLYLLCELLDMDLRAYVKRQSSRALPLKSVKHIARSVIEALHHCHLKGIIHRDLKPQNILVSSDLCLVKVSDFGLSRWLCEKRRTLTYEVVTLWYRSPELLLGESRYDGAIDVWSVGCIIAEIVYGYPLFPGDSELDTLLKIYGLLGTPTEADLLGGRETVRCCVDVGEFPKFKGYKFPLNFSAREDEMLHSFLKAMLQINPQKRATTQQLLNHPFLHQ